MNDFEVEIIITPMDMGFEPVPEQSITRSVTTVTNLDDIFHQAEEFIKRLPESAENDTGWS